MARIKCPACGKAYLEPVTEPTAERLFEGVKIVVNNARFSRCPVCGEETYSVGELARWRQVKDELLQSSAQTPVGRDFERLRDERGVSVANLANLLGVTRQAVYGWERRKDAPMKLGPAALLVRLLMREMDGSLHGVFGALCSFARERGQLIASESGSRDCQLDEDGEPRGRSICLSPPPPAGAPRFCTSPVAA